MTGMMTLILNYDIYLSDSSFHSIFQSGQRDLSNPFHRHSELPLDRGVARQSHLEIIIIDF